MIRRILFLLLLVVITVSSAFSQSTQTSLNMSVVGTTTLNPQLLMIYTIRDPGGSAPGTTAPYLTVTPDGNYQPGCNSWMLVRLPDDYIKVRGRVDINDAADYVEFYDGEEHTTATRMTHRDRNDTSIILTRYNSVDTVVQDCLSGYLWIHFYSNEYNQSPGFQLTLYCCPSGNQIYDVHMYNTSDTGMLITWQDSSNADRWIVEHSQNGVEFDYYHMDTIHSTCNLIRYDDYPNGNVPSFFHIFNNSRALMALGLCTSETYHYCIGGNDHNPDEYYATNGCYVSTHHGFWPTGSDSVRCDPDYHSHVSMESNCHTYIYDTTLHDANTYNQLRCVPPGGTESVRQGATGDDVLRTQYISSTTQHVPQYISNRYNCTFVVDTNVCNLLVLRYAVVMRAGCTRHADSLPYFRLSVGASGGDAMNNCYYQTYYGDSATLSTWHHYGDVYWTDWQAMAIDLSELHGLEEHIVLQTRNCIDQMQYASAPLNQGYGGDIHWCYAYLNVKNGVVEMPTNDCSGSEGIFTAPPDFTYRWINENDDTVGYNRSFSPNSSGFYTCDLLYHGYNDTLCNPTQLHVYNGRHYPVASYNYDVVGEQHCLPIVRFSNTSRIATDSAHTQMTEIRADSIYWTFDDTIHSRDVYPVVHLMPDTHTVQLIVSVDGGQCADTLNDTIIIPRVCPRDTVWDRHYKSICPNQLPYNFGGIIFDSAATDTMFIPAADPRWAGDTMRIRVLMLRTVSSSVTIDTIQPTQLPYTHNGTVYTGASRDTAYFDVGQQCDSMAVYILVVLQSGSSIQDSVVCSTQLPMKWNGCIFKARNDTAGAAYYTLSDTAILARASANGMDSIVVMKVTVMIGFKENTTDTVDREEPYQWREHTITRPGYYEDTYRSTDGCDSIYSLTLVWRVVPNGDLWIPNAFTPNESKDNRFFVQGTNIKKVEATVFNRWGDRVAHFEGLDGSWDGTYKGHLCPSGAYVYVIKYVNSNSPTVTQVVKGTILLIR